MKNIHVLSTDKPSRLYKHNELGLQLLAPVSHEVGQYNGSNQHIYITNDEEIKEGDWFVVELFKITGESDGLHIEKCTKLDDVWCNNFNVTYTRHKDNCKKIILTTDQDLIKDGVQSIDDEFLEWFVKNPSCEEVEIGEGVRYEDEWIDNEDGGEIFQHQYCSYKIIIPKEEPKYTTSNLDNEKYKDFSVAKQRAANYMSLKGALDSQYVDFSNPNADKITSGTTNKPLENKQTAMQQLINEIVEHLTYDDDLSDDSRMTLETIRLRCLGKLSVEKQQIIDAHTEGYVIGGGNGDLYNCKQYYNETYESKGSDVKDVILGYKTSLDAQMLDSQYVDFSNPNADKITSASTTTIKEEPKQIKCYCGHTTYCDCSPIETTPNKTNMTKQTAVEFLIKAFQGAYGEKVINVISVQVEQAKAMEKEQILNAHNQGYADGYRDNGNSPIDYYNETFKQQ